MSIEHICRDCLHCSWSSFRLHVLNTHCGTAKNIFQHCFNLCCVFAQEICFFFWNFCSKSCENFVPAFIKECVYFQTVFFANSTKVFFYFICNFIFAARNFIANFYPIGVFVIVQIFRNHSKLEFFNPVFYYNHFVLLKIKQHKNNQEQCKKNAKQEKNFNTSVKCKSCFVVNPSYSCIF